jgi:high-affinity Fe2+/Pb2+ permease
MDDDSIRGSFWLKMFGVLLAIGLGIGLSFALITNAIMQWGFVGGFIAIAVVLLIGGWLYDRRQAKLEREWDV